MKSYVAFIVPSPTAPEKGIAVPFPVESRDIDDLDIPAQACGFYFYDAPAAIRDPQDTLKQQHNTSKVYLLAHTLLTREDVKTLLAGPQHERSTSLQWDPRVEAHDLFIVTRNHAVQPVTDRHIVITGDRVQLHPPGGPDKPAKPHQKMSDIFNPVLQSDLVVRKPLRLHRRPPPSAPPAP